MSKALPAISEPIKRRLTLSQIVFYQKSTWVSIVLFSLVINLMMLVPAIYNLQIFDRVMSSRNVATLVAISAIALVLLAISAALEWARSRIMVRIGVKLDRTLGAQLLRLSHRMGIEKNGGAGQQLNHDLNTIRHFLTGYGVLAALDIPWVPIFLFVVFMLHPVLAMIMLGSGLFLTLLTFMTERAIEKPLDRATQLSAEAMRFSSIHMRNAEVIESMGMLGSMVERWQGKQDEYLRQQAIASDRAGLLQAISKGVRVINQSMTMGFGAFFSIQGDMSMGAMIAASLLAGRILGPIEQFIASWSMWGSALASWKRVNEALQYPEKVYTGVKLPPPKGEIALEGLSGCAPSSDTPFVKNVTLKIPAGSSVAIVGPSASGKSSLLRLIAGVWLPKAGVVRIDGSDLKTWPREDLGPFVGYLPQDVELIEGTVAENIARHAEVDSEKVIAAATAAGVHEMILRLSNSYGTQVGVNGAYLSGGQRQRLGLARALYGDPPLLILDEPNSNLDEAGEIALDRALSGAKKKGQTVLIVSHRPIAIRNCDLVMVMQGGQVSLYGPREPVMTALANAAKAAGGAAVAQKSDKALDNKAIANKNNGNEAGAAGEKPEGKASIGETGSLP
jgi:PrtD family type I secretion system ABC transporter